MPDHLAELRRQRALIAAHLAWLDREIEAASGKTDPAPAPSGALAAQDPALATAIVAAALKAQTAAATPEHPAVAAAADTILEEYRIPSETLKTDVRKGCFLYFAAALLFVAATAVILYFVLRRA